MQYLYKGGFENCEIDQNDVLEVSRDKFIDFMHWNLRIWILNLSLLYLHNGTECHFQFYGKLFKYMKIIRLKNLPMWNQQTQVKFHPISFKSYLFQDIDFGYSFKCFYAVKIQKASEHIFLLSTNYVLYNSIVWYSRKKHRKITVEWLWIRTLHIDSSHYPEKQQLFWIYEF